MRFVSEDALALLDGDEDAARRHAEGMIRQGRETELAEQVLGLVAGQQYWQRELTLERLCSLASGSALLEPLTEALRDPSDAERRNAARSALAALCSPQSAAVAEGLARLAGLLHSDADADVRVLAATALGESGNPAASAALQDGLEDPEPNVAAAAADGLGVLKSVEAVEALGAAASGADFWVRIAAVVALGRIGDRRAVSTLVAVTSDPLLAEAAATALGQLGDPAALDALRPLAQRSHPTHAAAVRAAELILESNPRLRPPEWLRETLRGSEAELATLLERDGDPTAARLLGIAGTRAAAERLLVALASPHAAAAAVGLASLPADVATTMLIPQLREVGPEARVSILATLPPLNDAAAIRAVAGHLSDPWEPARAAASEALGRSDPAEVLPQIREALEDPASRYAAVRTLGFLGDDRCTPLAAHLADADAAVRRAAAEGLIRCATPGVRERIVGALREESNAAVRAALVEALGSTGGADAVAHLEPLLADPDPVLRFAVIRALGHTRAPEALPALVAALGDQRHEFQAAALGALGELGQPSAADSVASFLGVANRDIRLTAALALRDIAAPRALEYLLAALDDDSWGVRQAAVRTLAAIGAEPALERLRRMADHDADPLVREAARSAVEQMERSGRGGGDS
jgi:HEAT repeat protein